MNPFEFVITIIVITGAFSLVRYRISLRHQAEQSGIKDAPEAARLRDEVKELKERLKVLERITVDRENTLTRQIDELRDR